MSRVKASTSKKIKQRVKELTAPTVVPGNTYIFAPAGRQQVERLVLEVTEKTVKYMRPSGPTTCQLTTFQRLYKLHGAGVIEGEAAKA
ncbi:hypothetical protein [Paenibacillus sp. IHBB 3054]|uniref:hypothetical protein n=1 Tax=Paenibacillus sp. IHBB 3054 TaxID=3425689 RepID=UPI003F67A5CB